MARRLEQIIQNQWNDSQSMMWWNGQWLTAERVFDMSRRTEEVLKASGIGTGDRIITFLPVCPAFHFLCLAGWSLGATIVPLNALAKPQAVEAIVRRIDGAVSVLAPDLEPLKGNYEALGTPCVVTPLEGVLEGFTARRGEKDDSNALIFCTSGTTGFPKAVPLTHENIISDVEQSIAHAIRVHEKTCMFNVLPNFHTLGCVVSGVLPMAGGFRQVLRSSFLPVEGTMRAIEEGCVTMVVTVPTMLHFLTGMALKHNWKPSSLEMIISGGDRLDGALEQRAHQAFDARLVEGYGLTETSPVLAVTATDVTHRTGTVGTFLPEVEYRLTDLDGQPQSGDEGLLWVRGPSVVQHYFRDSVNTKERFDDGWFNTGDMVRVDETGVIAILERVSDLIIVGGFNVYPQEVEEVLESHEAVAASAVVGCRQSVTGETIYGFIVLKDGHAVSASELTDWCRDRLPHYKLPRRIEFLSELPRNPLGKVLRRALREKCDS